MTHLRPRPALRLARRALALGVGLVGLGTIAGAAPKPRPRHHSSSKSSHKSESSSRKHTTASKKKHADVAERHDSTPALPTLSTTPSVVQLATADLTTGPASPLTDAASAAGTLSEGSAVSSPLASFNASAERLLSALLDRARSQLGTRYVFGGTKPGLGLDCSAFARFAMEALGIQLPRTAAQQARIGTPVPRDRTMLKPGDLLTFGRGNRVSHVGIYVGEGRFVHAPSTGGTVRLDRVDAPYWREHFEGGRRILE